MLPRRARNTQNRIARALISFVVLMLVVVVSVKCYELRQKRSEYMLRANQLQADIEYEQSRAEEIKEYQTYTQTKAYVEEVARDRLGLVYEGEILFRDESQRK